MKKLYLLFVLMFAIFFVILIKNVSAATGVCYVENRCSENVDKTYCENEAKGNFLGALAKDSYEQCKLGCCKLSSSYVYTSKGDCGNKALEQGISLGWDSSVGQEACEARYTSADKGCCKIEDNNCKASMTRDACNSLGGNFFKGTDCAIKDCQCKGETAKKECSEDRFSIIYSDSCGVEKVDECDFANGYICDNGACVQKLNCDTTWDNPIVIEDGGPRKNFESWCEYESITGPGLDLPGSEHYKHSCINGKEIAERCGDARDSICTYKDVAGFSTAQCETYTEDAWEGCMKCNRLDAYETANDYKNTDKRKECCKAAGKCVFTAGENLGQVCVPLVPPGTKDTCGGGEADTPIDDKSIESNVANPVVDVSIVPSISIYTNYFAYTDEAFIKANEFCRAQGDCGVAFDLTTAKIKNEGLRRIMKPESLGPYELLPEFIQKELDMEKGRYKTCLDAKKAQPNSDVNILGIMVSKDESCIKVLFPGYLSTDVINRYILYAKYLSVQKGRSQTIGLYGDDYSSVPGRATVLYGLIDSYPFYTKDYTDQSIGFKNIKGNPGQWVAFKCKPWEPVDGGANCEKCDLPMSKGGLLPDTMPEELKKSYQCTPYKCKSLGSTCDIVNTPEGDKCVDIGNDKSFPEITFDQASLKVTCKEGYNCVINDAAIADGYEISGKIKEFTKITFGIKTINTDSVKKGQPELSQCKHTTDVSVSNIHDAEKRFNAMSGDLEPEGFAYAHSITLTNLGSGERDETYTYYISCKDASGNYYPKLYAVRFTVNKAPDLNYPVIESFEPKSSTKIANILSEKDVNLEINERKDSDNEKLSCRWSKQDTEFNQMPTENEITKEVAEQGKSTLTLITFNNLTKGENKFYFRCKDAENNVAPIGKQYTLIKTDKLTITNVEPKGNIFVSKFNLTVTTSGGAEQGKANCSYGLKDIYEGGEMQETNSNVHRQEQGLEKGGYTYYIQCKDAAENYAKAQSRVYVKTDTTAPKLVGISLDTTYGNKLKIITNDETKVRCKYESSDFSFDNGRDMQTVGDAPLLSHYADYGLGTYYIKCKDEFNNLLPIIIYT